MEINVPGLLRIKKDAMHKIGKYVKQCGYSRIALICGEGISQMFNTVLEISFASSDVKVLFEHTASSNNLDDAFSCAKKIPKAVQAVVAIGGGKAIDFSKYVALINQLPVFSVPTLISNDGFASPFSSMLVDGKRKTIKTRIPDAVVVDTAVIAKTPERFIYSGMGDLFCKLTSTADWKLAYKKNGELVNDFASTICVNSVNTFAYYPHKDITDCSYLGIMISSLLMSGIAMEIAGSSRPASGAEHMISHAYDSLCASDSSIKPSIHGLQVGVASYVTSFLQGYSFESLTSIITECGFAKFMEKEPLNKKTFLEAVRRAPEVKEDYYTILSEKDSFDRVCEFIETDDLAKKMIQD